MLGQIPSLIARTEAARPEVVYPGYKTRPPSTAHRGAIGMMRAPATGRWDCRKMAFFRQLVIPYHEGDSMMVMLVIPNENPILSSAK